MKFAIIGYGVVGEATRDAAEFHGHECVCIMDKEDWRLGCFPPDHEPPHPRLNSAEIAFVCVDTPSLPDGSCDTSNVEAAVADLEARRFHGVVAIRSTVPPGTTAAIANAHHPHDMRRFLHNPEFLRMRDAEHTSRWPAHVVIGGCDAYVPHMPESDPYLKRLLRFYEPYFEGRERAPVFVTNWATSEFYKYASNALLALAIIGAEQLYDVAEAVGADWNTCFSIAQHCPVTPKAIRVDPEDRGFGGPCLPKDLKALMAFGEGPQMWEPSPFYNATCHNHILRAGNEERRQGNE